MFYVSLIFRLRALTSVCLLGSFISKYLSQWVQKWTGVECGSEVMHSPQMNKAWSLVRSSAKKEERKEGRKEGMKEGKKEKVIYFLTSWAKNQGTVKMKSNQTNYENRSLPISGIHLLFSGFLQRLGSSLWLCFCRTHSLTIRVPTVLS